MAERAIIGLSPWLATPSGRYLLEWEQAHLDDVVADVFGFHALQLGMPELDALRMNRMPHRWVATEDAHAPVDGRAAGADEADEEEGTAAAPPRAAVALRCDFDALPFDANSLDLVVLPHALELARDPHLALREVDRVLRPEGRVVIVGFNPGSLWGLRQQWNRWRGRLAPRADGAPFLSGAAEFLRYRRLRDWLRLLSFEVEAGRFGCYRPPLASAQWLARFEWMDRVGDRWWPVFGAVYFVVAVKRVRGMRLIGLARQQRGAANAAPAPVVALGRHRRAARTAKIGEGRP
jgi:SAM-dependent methyltransferase